MKMRSEEEIKLITERIYRENPDLRPITMDELALLSVDKKGFLHWEGTPIKIKRRLSLNLWQGFLAFVAAFGTFISAIVQLLEYLKL